MLLYSQGSEREMPKQKLVKANIAWEGSWHLVTPTQNDVWDTSNDQISNQPQALPRFG